MNVLLVALLVLLVGCEPSTPREAPSEPKEGIVKSVAPDALEVEIESAVVPETLEKTTEESITAENVDSALKALTEEIEKDIAASSAP